MEDLEGYVSLEKLLALCSEEKRLTSKQKANICVAILSSLHKIHEVGRVYNNHL
jgi:hypothetical protein